MSIAIVDAKCTRPSCCYFFDVDLDYYHNTLGLTTPRRFIVWIILGFCGWVQMWRKEALMPEYCALEMRMGAKLTRRDKKIREMQLQIDAQDAELKEKRAIEAMRMRLLGPDDPRLPMLLSGALR